MGCFYSHETDKSDGYESDDNYNASTNARRRGRYWQDSYSTPAVSASRSAQPLYGEYQCTSCGRQWNSLLSWRGRYQMCKRCMTQVYPTNQRGLRPSDRTRNVEDVGEHPKEYCQKCQQQGRYCGISKKTGQRRRKWSY